MQERNFVQISIFSMCFNYSWESLHLRPITSYFLYEIKYKRFFLTLTYQYNLNSLELSFAWSVKKYFIRRCWKKLSCDTWSSKGDNVFPKDLCLCLLLQTLLCSRKLCLHLFVFYRNTYLSSRYSPVFNQEF